MSVEASVLAAVVEEGKGGLRKMYQAGVTAEDFPVYEEEIAWIERRISEQKPVTPRIFRRKFDDFPWLPPQERLQDLLPELKQERAFADMNTLLVSVAEELEPDNAIEKSEFLREALASITRLHAPHTDHLLVSDWQRRVEEMRTLRSLRKGGTPPGIPTELAWIDHHWDGLVNGRMIVVLGRPGEGKSYILMKFGWSAVKNGYRVLLFSPELSKHENECRFETMASADPSVKEAVGLQHSFRNRALMNGVGFNMKKYAKFKEYIASLKGELILMTSTHRGSKMSPQFVESRIADIAPDLVIIDPIYKLKPPRRRDSPVWEISDCADSVQDMAESFNIPVVVTNQAHRQGGNKADAPHKDTSFNSDVPIQEADHVIGVKNISDEHRMIVRCSKSRFGQDFRFEMKFFPNTGVMKEINGPTDNYYNGNDEDVEDEELKEVIATAVKGD